MAKFTFVSFLFLIIMSLVFLIPGIPPAAGGPISSPSPSSTRSNGLYSARGAWRDHLWVEMGGPLATFVVLEALAGAAWLWIGIRFLGGHVEFGWLVASVVFTLPTNAKDSWGFLVGLALLRKRKEGAQRRAGSRLPLITFLLQGVEVSGPESGFSVASHSRGRRAVWKGDPT